MTTTPGQGATTDYGDPLQVSPSTQTSTPTTGSGTQMGSGSPPATEQAKHAAETTKAEAKNVAGTAASEAKNVAETAAAEAKGVAGEAKAQARDLVSEARTQVSQQSRTQRDRLTQVLDQAADELRTMADSGGGDGVATEMVRQFATRAQDFSSFLGQHEPSELVTEVRRFARRRPGAFLLGAVVAGALAGRMAKGAASSSGPSRRSDDASRAYAGSEYMPPPTPAPVDPMYSTGTLGAAATSSQVPPTTPLREYERSEYETSQYGTSGAAGTGEGQSSIPGGRP